MTTKEALAQSIEITGRLARALDKLIDLHEAESAEVSEWIAAVDTKVGRLSAIVADHEERLTA